MNTMLPLVVWSLNNKEVRRRSQNAILTSAIPASADMHAIMGALMATQQAKQSIVEQQRAVEHALEEGAPGIAIAAGDVVVAARTAGVPVTEDLVQNNPTLAPFATPEVVSALAAAADDELCPGSANDATLNQIVRLASEIQANHVFPTADQWAKDLTELAALLGPERVAKLTQEGSGASALLPAGRSRAAVKAKGDGETTK